MLCASVSEALKADSCHPTGLLYKAGTQLLRTLTLCTGIHADNMQPEAIQTQSGLLRTLVDVGCSHPVTLQNHLESEQIIAHFCLLMSTYQLSQILCAAQSVEKNVIYPTEGNPNPNPTEGASPGISGAGSILPDSDSQLVVQSAAFMYLFPALAL